MALVTESVTCNIRPRPFAGIIGSLDWPTIAARAEMLGIVQRESITGPGAGNNQVIEITGDLPANFAYVHLDTMVALQDSSGGAPAYRAQNSYQVFDAATAGNRSYRVEMGLEELGDGTSMIKSGSDRWQSWKPSNPWKGIVQPLTSTDNVRFKMWIYNSNTDSADITLDVTTRWLQYDLNQVANWEVNSAIPTR